jgi:hypothetical protein
VVQCLVGAFSVVLRNVDLAVYGGGSMPCPSYGAILSVRRAISMSEAVLKLSRVQDLLDSFFVVYTSPWFTRPDSRTRREAEGVVLCDDV